MASRSQRSYTPGWISVYTVVPKDRHHFRLLTIVLRRLWSGADQVIIWWGGLAEVFAESCRVCLRPWVGARKTHITPVARDQAEVVRVSPLPAGVDGLRADETVHSALDFRGVAAATGPEAAGQAAG